MNQFTNPSMQSAAVDAGLRSFLMGTYRKMTLAMIVSMVVAWAFGNFVLIDPATGGLSSIGAMLYSPAAALGLTIGIVVLFGAIGRKLNTMSVGAVNIFLFAFAAIMGVWLSAIAVFANPIIAAKVFFMAAAAFASVSIYGYVTKRDLGGIAKFAFMVFFGFIAITLLGMFIPAMAPTGGLYIVFQLVGLVAICAITAWETQHLKSMYYATVGNPEMAEKLSTYGAASLLLSFINIFSILMNLFGGE